MLTLKLLHSLWQCSFSESAAIFKGEHSQIQGDGRQTYEEASIKGW